jgi:DNA modification methylase
MALRPIHPFPARMAPSIAQRRLRSKRKLRVLDPMAGSGTTLVAARLYGHQAVGFDTDPLALVIAKAWSSNVSSKRVRQRASEVLSKAREHYPDIAFSEAYPAKADSETRAFIRFWFDPTNRRQLKTLSEEIAKVSDSAEKALLWASFSRLIVTKDAGASLARDVSHSRPHRAFTIAPVRPFERFLAAVDSALRASHFGPGSKLPAAAIRHGDARSLPLPDGSIDLVITSPPYLNAIDYLRGHKLSLVWMGHCIKDVRTLRSNSIGAESAARAVATSGHISSALGAMCDLKKLSEHSRGMLVRYVHDMNSVLAEVSRVLKRRGQAVIVIGNSTIRGVFVKNSSGLMYLARVNGLRLNSTRRRPLLENRRYLPPPGRRISGKLLGTRMREEVILTFAKASSIAVGAHR